MENKLVIDALILKLLLDRSAESMVGKCMKRFELSANKDEIKKQVKELIYEGFRDTNTILKAYGLGKETINVTFDK